MEVKISLFFFFIYYREKIEFDHFEIQKEKDLAKNMMIQSSFHFKFVKFRFLLLLSLFQISQLRVFVANERCHRGEGFGAWLEKNQVVKREMFFSFFLLTYILI